MVSCPGPTLMWGLPGGHEAPSVSKREGGAMSNDSAAPRLYLAFQGRSNYALGLFQPKQTKNFRSQKRLLLRKITAPHFSSPRGGGWLGWRRMGRGFSHGDLGPGEGPVRPARPARGCEGKACLAPFSSRPFQPLGGDRGGS